MNVTLSGPHPEFGRWRFSWDGGVVQIVDAAGEESPAPPGLATELVRALGANPPPGAPREHRIEVDQTNVSVVVADRWIVKLIAEPGTADRSAAIERRLAGASIYSAAERLVVPPFLGSVVWEHPTRGATTIALVSEFVSGADDGWTWAPDDVIDAPPGRDPEWPAALGELTARMHLALAAAEFPEGDVPMPDPAAEADAVWSEVAAEYATRSDAAGPRIRNRLAALRDALRDADAPSSAPQIVIHGDLHVGQVLRDSAGEYFIIDFDGDPQWGGEHPWRRLPAARDVAHMLVSIDLVAAVAQKRAGRAGGAFFAWADRAQRTYLDAYGSSLLAAGQQRLFDQTQLEWMCAEQLLLELRYAARYLASWEYAPDAVISHRYLSSAHESEQPWTPPASPTT